MTSEKGAQVKRQREQEEEMKQLKQLGMLSLFQYECGETTNNRYISCMDWSDVNPDLLAVSYGELDHVKAGKKRDGLLLFWTLKNPQFPERTIKTKSRLTSCMFSKKNPNLIAVGDYDGGIAIYDLRQASNDVRKFP